uniref:lysine-specific demethylase 2B-like isoform X2 n=1 Tax=Myxine glutinosa TaxID=7769 RepID=UPI0035901C94
MDGPGGRRRLRSVARRRYELEDISDDEIEGKRTFNVEDKLRSDRYNANFVRYMKGKDFTYRYVQEEGLRVPLVFESPEGLDIRMPDADFGVNDVKMCVGSRRVVDVMDVMTQKGIEMTMSQWARYYNTPEKEREKLYNVISLEFSHTRLEGLVQRPAVVDQLDWVDAMWPRQLKERQTETTNVIAEMKYPKVQKYCLMSVKGCYTDFHIDFGGTSVWYHILRGGKVFWLVPPSPRNLEVYEGWVLSGKQGDIFLADRADACQRIHLQQGFTFLIPSGWLHAVYTPEDALVFGGNFLHSFNIPMQLAIHELEDKTHVPAKFRYPFYFEMAWYVLERYVYSMTGRSHLELKPALHLYDEDDDGQNGRTTAVKEEKVEGALTMTPFELTGLRSLLARLEALPENKQCVPKGIVKSEALLHEVRVMLTDHSHDNPQTAITGVPIVSCPPRLPRPKTLTMLHTAATSKSSHLSSTAISDGRASTAISDGRASTAISVASGFGKHRRTRCRRCDACMRTECGSCNFCKDMKKFGGPGRMKQSCLMRQCISPMLPNVAACVVCGGKDDDYDEDGEKKDVRREGKKVMDEETFLQILMECSICNEIVHPGCLKLKPSLGVVNEELPNCWECPSCTEKGKSGKKRGPGFKFASHLPGSLLKQSGNEKRSYPENRGAQSSTEKRLLLSSKLKGVGGLSLRRRLLPRHIRLGLGGVGGGRIEGRRWKKRKEHDDKLKSGLPASKESRTSREASSPALSARLRRSSPRRMPLESVSERVREKYKLLVGRRVASVDGGNSSDPLSRYRIPKRKDATRILAEKQLESNGQLAGNRAIKIEVAETPTAPVMRTAEVSVALATRSVEVPLAPPVQAVRAVTSRTVDAPVLCGVESTGSPGKPHRKKQKCGIDGDRVNGSGMRHGTTSSSPLRKGSAERDGGAHLETLGALGAGREAWMCVFQFLTHEELCTCMLVCKMWNRWCCDRRLWPRMNLSSISSVPPSMLSGIIRRQPVALDLSHSAISRKQLVWLLNRLPGLKDLSLAGCPWVTVSALTAGACPLLQSLDISDIMGVNEENLRELFSPASGEGRSRLRSLSSLRLCGLGTYMDTVLRLVTRHATLVSSLDLARCPQLIDQSINLLSGVGNPSRENLTYVCLSACPQLTDECLPFLRRCSRLRRIDLRFNPKVSSVACERLAKQLPGHFDLPEPQLLQKRL